MNNIDKIYIAREYLLCGVGGCVRVDKESIFISFADAKEFICSLRQGGVDVKSNRFLLYRLEIVEYELGRVESYLRRWVYNVRGELLANDTIMPAETASQGPTQANLFNVGDIVRITPEVFNQQSPVVRETFGVVVECPVGRDKIHPENDYDFGDEYIIYYITEFGFLGHLHVREGALNIAYEVPGECKFLEIYSRYLNRQELLPENIIERLFRENIFIKNVPMFDFNRGVIMEVKG